MICKHDMNVFINRQLIYNYPEQVWFVPCKISRAWIKNVVPHFPPHHQKVEEEGSLK